MRNRNHWLVSHLKLYGVVIAAMAMFSATYLLRSAIANAAVAGVQKDQREVARLKPMALGGDGRSAAVLSHHFRIIGDPKESTYWFRIAIENGDDETLQEYAGRLWGSGGLRNCTRALFLMGEVAGSPVRRSTAAEREVAEQLEEMKGTVAQCSARRCSVEVAGAWCD